MRSRPRTNQLHNRQEGFTLIELLVVVAIVAGLFAVSSVNLGNPQSTASLGSVVEGLVADIKSQQVLAMSGDQGSTTASQPQGVRIQPTNYTTFAGASFNAGDSNNFVVAAGQDVTLSTTLPSSLVIFAEGTGEVTGFVSGSNTITVTHQGTSKVITINRLGTVTVN